MKYKKEERLDIGRQIYNGEISRYEAAERKRKTSYRLTNPIESARMKESL